MYSDGCGNERPLERLSLLIKAISYRAMLKDEKNPIFLGWEMTVLSLWWIAPASYLYSKKVLHIRYFFMHWNQGDLYMRVIMT